MSDDVFIIGVLSLLYAWVLLLLPCVILPAPANAVYRLAAGRFFRRLSLRTVVPLAVVTLVGWAFFYHLLKNTSTASVITH